MWVFVCVLAARSLSASSLSVSGVACCDPVFIACGWERHLWRNDSVVEGERLRLVLNAREQTDFWSLLNWTGRGRSHPSRPSLKKSLFRIRHTCIKWWMRVCARTAGCATWKKWLDIVDLQQSVNDWVDTNTTVWGGGVLVGVGCLLSVLIYFVLLCFIFCAFFCFKFVFTWSLRISCGYVLGPKGGDRKEWLWVGSGSRMSSVNKYRCG